MCRLAMRSWRFSSSNSALPLLPRSCITRSYSGPKSLLSAVERRCRMDAQTSAPTTMSATITTIAVDAFMTISFRGPQRPFPFDDQAVEHHACHGATHRPCKPFEREAVARACKLVIHRGHARTNQGRTSHADNHDESPDRIGSGSANPFAEEEFMSKTPRRTLDEVQASLADLAHRVVVDPGNSLDLDLRDRLLDVIDELELFIPGLEPPADPNAARQLTAAAAAALGHGRPRIALARAMRGLSFSPHHAELFYLASSACFELAAT